MTRPSKRKTNGAASAAGDLLFLPLGGAGEIGMNLNLFGYGGRWLMVDLGVTFGDDTMPGVDVVMPDPAFIVENKDKLDGLVLTHAHEDHIGAVQYLWERLRCPLYATPFTASVLRRKLGEVGLADEAKITVVDCSSRFKVGEFDIEMVTLTHSIPEPNALVIRTPRGTILHTGDWKLDPNPLVGPPTDEAALRRIGDEGVLALIGDSTNVFKKGVAGSEADVRESLIDLVSRYDQRVCIASFASNVARLETIAVVAEKNGRHAGLVGRSLWNMYDAAKENGYLKGIRPFLTEDEVMRLPRNKVLIGCTGSQGEPRAALSRIASGSHPSVGLDPDDVVIFSSRIIPGNELSIGRLHDALIKKDIQIITERDHFVHVSGHPARDELVQMYQWIRPQIAVPVHGEVRHLFEHQRLARACQVPSTKVAVNGQIVRLAPGPVEIIDEVTSGRLAVDGTNLVPMGGAVLRERKRLMFNGSVVATVVLDGEGELLSDPQVTLSGLVDMDEDVRFHDDALDAVEDAIDEMPKRKRTEDGAVEEAVRRELRAFMRAALGKKPSVSVHVVRLD